MSIKKYTTFLKVVECGSITKAAEQLGHTQSGVTQLLQALEHDLGLPLMIRNRSGIVLTEAGRKLYPLISEVVACDEKLNRAVEDLNRSDMQTITIGTFKSVAINWLPTMIQEYQQFEPDIRFELTDGGYNDMERTLANREVDFAFLPLPTTVPCNSIPLYRDRLLAVVPADHPATAGKRCPIELFETEPVIGLLDYLDRDSRTVLTDAGIHPNIKYMVEDDYAMIAMVAKNLGICIVPELILSGNEQNVRIMELEPPAYRTIGIAFPANKTTKDSALRFSDFVSRWVADNMPDNEDKGVYPYVDCRSMERL